jgi:hypothetical protein
MSDEITRRMLAGPTYFPQNLDLARDQLLLVELSEAEIAAASFLDQRIMSATTRGGWVTMAEAMARADHAGPDDAHYIFHIGHVGSSLISRLLGLLPAVMALREPLVLRGIAEAVAKAGAVDAPWSPDTVDARVTVLRRLLARPFRTGQRTIIKATSFASDIADRLVAPGSRALFLYASPDRYFRTILAGENSRRELAMMTGPRLVRLARWIDPMPYRLWSLGLGEQVALGWATEMRALSAAADALPDGAVMWLDFDDFLYDPLDALRRIATHFALSLDDSGARRLATDPLMGRYSKGPEHAYSADLRRQLLDQAGREHGEPLRRAHHWLAELARDDAAFGRLLHAKG